MHLMGIYISCNCLQCWFSCRNEDSSLSWKSRNIGLAHQGYAWPFFSSGRVVANHRCVPTPTTTRVGTDHLGHGYVASQKQRWAARWHDPSNYLGLGPPHLVCPRPWTSFFGLVGSYLNKVGRFTMHVNGYKIGTVDGFARFPVTYIADFPGLQHMRPQHRQIPGSARLKYSYANNLPEMLWNPMILIARCSK